MLYKMGDNFISVFIKVRVIGSNVFTSGRWIVLQAVEGETGGRRYRPCGGVQTSHLLLPLPRGTGSMGTFSTSTGLQQALQSAVHLSVSKVNGAQSERSNP